MNTHALRTPPLRRQTGALALVMLATFLWAWLVAFPAARGAGLLLGQHPEGDALLWRAGSFWLLEAWRHLREGRLVVQSLLPWTVLGWMALSLLLWTNVLVGWAEAPWSSLAQRGQAVIRRLLPLTLLFVLSGVTRAVIIAAGLLLAQVLPTWLSLPDGYPQRDLAALGGGLLAAGVYGIIGLWHDVAKGVCVQRKAGVLASLGRALSILWRQRRRMVRGYVGSTLGQLLVVGTTAFVVDRLGVATEGHIVWVAGIHQGAVAGLVMIQAWWLRQTVEVAAIRGSAAADFADECDG